MKKLRKLLFSSLLLLASGLTACHEAAVNYNFETVRIGDITEHGIHIRRLSSGIDGDSHPYQTLSYTTVPAYTKEAVTASISFADNRNNGSNYLTYSLDPIEHTVTVTCLQGFDSLGTLRLLCPTSQAYADVIIHYYGRVTGISEHVVVGGLNAYDDDGYNEMTNCYLYNYHADEFSTAGMDKSEPLGNVISNLFRVDYAACTDESSIHYSNQAFFASASDANSAYDSSTHSFTGTLPEIKISNNSSYFQLGTGFSSSNPAGTWVTDNAHSNAATFLRGVIRGIDMNTISNYGSNVFYNLWNSWSSASTSTRNYLAQALSGGYWYVRFQLRNAVVARVVENQTLGDITIQTCSTSDSWIYLRIEPIPDMGIGDSANSVSSESSSLYF